jgi:hypothetical protein
MADPFAGTWRLVPERSEFDPNHRPAAATVVFELEAEDRYVMTAEGRNSEGKPVAEKPQRLIADAKPHPLPDFQGLSVVTTRPDANTLHTEVRREDGSIAGGGTYAVEVGGKTMRATTFGYDSQLRQFKQVTVWNRE